MKHHFTLIFYADDGGICPDDFRQQITIIIPSPCFSLTLWFSALSIHTVSLVPPTSHARIEITILLLFLGFFDCLLSRSAGFDFEEKSTLYVTFILWPPHAWRRHWWIAAVLRDVDTATTFVIMHDDEMIRTALSPAQCAALSPYRRLNGWHGLTIEHRRRMPISSSEEFNRGHDVEAMLHRRPLTCQPTEMELPLQMRIWLRYQEYRWEGYTLWK